MSYFDQLRGIADQYFAEHDGTASSRDIAGWAVRSGKWAPQPGSLIDQCAEELCVRNMRRESRKTAGRSLSGPTFVQQVISTWNAPSRSAGNRSSETAGS
jgi:hypothetical protein